MQTDLGCSKESHSWPIGPGFFHLDHPTSCAFRLRKGNRGKHAKILLFACCLQENIKSSPDKEYMYITVQKSSDTLHFFIFCKGNGCRELLKHAKIHRNAVYKAKSESVHS